VKQGNVVVRLLFFFITFFGLKWCSFVEFFHLLSFVVVVVVVLSNAKFLSFQCVSYLIVNIVAILGLSYTCFFFV
jgi:hypothetical protein